MPMTRRRGTVGHLEGRVAHLAGLLAEDGAEQALLSSELSFALRGDLADQNVAREHLGANANDAVGIEVGNHIVGDVRNLAGNFLGTELGVTCVDFVFRNMDRREEVLGRRRARR